MQLYVDTLQDAKKKYLRKLKARHDADTSTAKKKKLPLPPKFDPDQAVDSMEKAFKKYPTQVDGQDIQFFSGVYLAPRGSLQAFPHIKPVMMGDAAHMTYPRFKSIMMCCVGQDANRQLVPLQVGFAEGSEDTENWNDFNRHFRRSYPDVTKKPENSFSLITDQQKGLESSVRAQLSRVHHHCCAFHIHQKIIRHFRCVPGAKASFSRMVNARTEEEVGLPCPHDFCVYFLPKKYAKPFTIESAITLKKSAITLKPSFVLTFICYFFS